MQVSIDRAGRVVVPKSLRAQLGISPDIPLEIDVVDDHLEISARHKPPTVIDGPNGPIVAKTGTPISDDDVRAVLEAARDHR